MHPSAYLTSSKPLSSSAPCRAPPIWRSIASTSFSVFSESPLESLRLPAIGRSVADARRMLERAEFAADTEQCRCGPRGSPAKPGRLFLLVLMALLLSSLLNARTCAVTNFGGNTEIFTFRTMRKSVVCTRTRLGRKRRGELVDCENSRVSNNRLSVRR